MRAIDSVKAYLAVRSNGWTHTDGMKAAGIVFSSGGFGGMVNQAWWPNSFRKLTDPWPERAGFNPGGIGTIEFQRNSTSRSCLAWIQRNFIAARIRVQDGEGDDTEEIEGHAFTRLLNRPNPRYSSHWLWGLTLDDWWQNGTGNAYWLKERDAGGEVVQLWHVPALEMQPDWDRSKGASGPDAFVSQYLRTVNGITTPIPYRNVVHFRHLSGDPTNLRKGYSPLMSGQSEVGILNEGALYRGSLLTNHAVPSYALIPKDKEQSEAMSEDNAEAVEKIFVSKFTGRNRGAGLFIPNFMAELMRVGFSPEELDIRGSMAWDTDMICALYGISAMVLGLPSAEGHRTFCLPAAARVWTTAGAKRIAEVTPGEFVWSFVRGALTPRRVLRQWKTGRKPLLEVRTKNRTLRLTDNHPVLVRVPGPFGGKGMNNEQRRVRYAWKPAGELKPGDHVVQTHYLPDQEGTLLPNGKPATLQLLQFLGALMGDGNLIGGHAKRVCLSKPPEHRVTPAYRQMAEALFVKCDGSPVLVSDRPRAIEFCSADTVRELDSLGFAGTAKTKRIPGWVFGLARSFRLAFLAGLVDTDGSIDRRGCLSFTFANEVLTHEVRELLLSCGIQCGNIYYQTMDASCRPQGGRHLFYESWRFTASPAVEIARIPFVDPIYRERVEANSGRYRGDGFDAQKAGLAEELGFACIMGIRVLPAEDVYDLEVEDGHSFIADGIVVHNSNQADAREAGHRENIIPTQSIFAAELELQLLPDFDQDPSHHVGWDYSQVGVLQEDQNALRESVSLQVKSGIWSRNEGRIKQGLEPFRDPDSVRTITDDDGKEVEITDYDVPAPLLATGWELPGKEPAVPPGGVPGAPHVLPGQQGALPPNQQQALPAANGNQPPQAKALPLLADVVVTESDIAAARRRWRESVPERFADLLDAKPTNGKH
jgi:hypothetical protein